MHGKRVITFMPQSPAQNDVPLVVDLDGTLIETDLLWETLARVLRRNPLMIFCILFWWVRGRAFLKQRLGRRVRLEPQALPYHGKFLAWLRGQKAAGRTIVLATAADLQMARPVADYVGIFADVLASDGRTNLRGPNKLKVLLEKFGERGFDYAGNSSTDLAVWRGARKAIVVNASRSVQKQAAEFAEIGIKFCEANSSLATLKHFLMELFVSSGYLLAVAAGLLLAAAFPKCNFAGGAWIAPGLMIFAAQRMSGGDAFRTGLVAGLSFWLVSLYWLLEIPYRWHSIPLGPGLGWLALSFVLALFSGAWVWLTRRERSGAMDFWAGRLLWALAGAASWVALEMLRARVLGGFPFNFLGASQCKLIPLVQIASCTGIYGISFLVAWTSLAFYSAARLIFSRPNSRFAWEPEIFPPLLVVVCIFAFGEVSLKTPAPTEKTLRVALVQPAIPQTLIWDENENSNRFQQLLQLSETVLTNKVDLLVWPESAVPELTDATYAAITGLVRAHHVWLIFDADDVEPATNNENEYSVFNAAFFIPPGGGYPEIYHKQKLVMFGEYVPFTWLPFVKWFTPITGSYTPGKSAAEFQFENPGVTASPLICYEDLFPQLGRRAAAGGADFLVNLTNDGWFGESAEQWQHEEGALFRAVENGVPLVRCCNNGVSCWIDAHGRPGEIFRAKKEDVYGAGTMVFDLPLRKHAPTFYTRHGDWFGWSCVGIALLVAGRKLFRAVAPLP